VDERFAAYRAFCTIAQFLRQAKDIARALKSAARAVGSEATRFQIRRGRARLDAAPAPKYWSQLLSSTDDNRQRRSRRWQVNASVPAIASMHRLARVGKVWPLFVIMINKHARTLTRAIYR